MSGKIVIYTKDTCGYCHAAKSLLQQKGLAYTEIDVGYDAEKFSEMLKRSHNARTVPQIFFGDEHIGGFVDLRKYFFDRS